ncbi:TPA: LysM peptidoglycan-binding domain-containing protein [Enterobacter hormaechei]
MINNLIAHPYVVVNKYPAFRNHLIKKGIVSKTELDKYNIKNVARYLGYKAIKSEIIYYETLPNSVDTFSFRASNPVTQRLGSQLEVMSKFLSSKSNSNQQDFVHNMDDFAERKTDADVFKEKLDYLESNIRRDFNPINPIKELTEAQVNKKIQEIMNTHGAEIVSNDIMDSQHSLNEEIKSFSLETISSVNLAYDKVSSVSTLFAQAESDLIIKNQLKALLDEATGVNDEVVTDVDKTDAAEVSDMVYNRFRYNLNKLDEFLFKLKTGNYKSLVLFKYAQPDPSKPGAYALPFDSKKRILMAVQPKSYREGSLVDTVVHEASHVSSYTLDTTYIGNARGETGSFPSSFEASSRSLKNFFENEKVSNLSTKYILGLAENVETTEQQQYLAHAMLLSSRLTRADTFLKSAEYNAYIIHVLSRAKLMGSRIYFDETVSRSKRSVFGEDNNLDQMILIASLANAMPDSLHPSSGLSIEISPEKSESYIIKPGETLTSIAVKFYGKKKMSTIIYEANKDKFFGSDNVSAGTKLTIPKMVYTVKRGDTLESIALKFYGNNKHNIIYEANKKILSDKDSLPTGEKLIIPKRTYTVKNGETLKTIAMEFYGNTNKHRVIFDANQDKLISLATKYTAKRLVIPEIIYTTKDGDTLKSIARKIYGNKNKNYLIKEANNNLVISNGNIQPNQRLIIPKLDDIHLKHK